MSNPESKKYILQETRELRADEFVYRHGREECACKDHAFWEHLREVHKVDYEKIANTILPDDSQGNRMWGLRIKKVEDEWTLRLKIKKMQEKLLLRIITMGTAKMMNQKQPI